MIEVQKREDFPKLDEKEIELFQSQNELQLPIDYVSFLKNSNGGKPVKNKIKNTSYVLSHFFGFIDDPQWASIFNAIETYQNRIPSWYFPIAKDAFGNLLVMSLHKDNFGFIAFWDHENEAKEDAQQYFDNMELVCKSFKELENLLE